MTSLAADGGGKGGARRWPKGLWVFWMIFFSWTKNMGEFIFSFYILDMRWEVHFFVSRGWTGFLVTLISKCTGGHCESTSACILSIISTSRRFVIHPTAIWRIFTHPKILRSPPKSSISGVFHYFHHPFLGLLPYFFGYTHIFFVGASSKTNLSSVITLSSCFPRPSAIQLKGVGGWWWWKPLGAIDDCCGQEKEAIDLKVGPWVGKKPVSKHHLTLLGMEIRYYVYIRRLKWNHQSTS